MRLGVSSAEEVLGLPQDGVALKRRAWKQHGYLENAPGCN
jgi:hypothetical protein